MKEAKLLKYIILWIILMFTLTNFTFIIDVFLITIVHWYNKLRVYRSAQIVQLH